MKKVQIGSRRSQRPVVQCGAIEQHRYVPGNRAVKQHPGQGKKPCKAKKQAHYLHYDGKCLKIEIFHNQDIDIIEGRKPDIGPVDCLDID